MPLPRKKDDGTGGAPVLDIMSARVRFFDVEEHIEPYTITRKRDGAEFWKDPDFNCTVEIVDDGEDGEDNGTKFFESFKYKKDKNGKWFLNSNSKLGVLAGVVKPGYWGDPSIQDLTTDDLEGFEMRCRVKPKKNPNKGGEICGSTIDWETMRPLSKKRPPLATAADGGYVADEDEPLPEEN